MKELVVKEFISGGILEYIMNILKGRYYKKGQKYSFFKDPETGKYYRPKKNFVVTGEDLNDRFEEVPCE